MEFLCLLKFKIEVNSFSYSYAPAPLRLAAVVQQSTHKKEKLRTHLL